MQKVVNIMMVLYMLIPAHTAQSQESAVDSVVTVVTDAVFSEIERQLIKNYYGNQPVAVDRDEPVTNLKGLPPGLANRELPPGLAKQIQRNGTLPPGLAKRNFPLELERQLPPVREGYERTIIEEVAIVLIEKATGRIADVILDTTEEAGKDARPGKRD